MNSWKTPVIATEAQVQALISSDPRNYREKAAKVILSLAAFQGFKPGQVRALTVFDIDLDNNLVLSNLVPYPLDHSAAPLTEWLKVRHYKPGITSLITGTHGTHNRDFIWRCQKTLRAYYGLANSGGYVLYYQAKLERETIPSYLYHPSRAIKK